MALRTFTDAGDGLWSTAANWDTGVPVDGDTFALGAGETVEFDVDQSGFAAGMGASTIVSGGSVVCSTTAGTYHMKMNGDLIIAGTDGLKAGTSTSVPLPSTVTFTIEFNAGAFSIEGNDAGSIKLYCTEPTNKYVVLDEQEPAAETVMSCDGYDVTADIWAAGDDVAIVDLFGSSTAEDSEKQQIAGGGIAATSITLAAGLGAQKEIGSHLFLLQRNIEIMGSTTYAFEDCPNSEVHAYFNCVSICYSSTGITTGGAAWTTGSNNYYVCNSATSSTVHVGDGLGGSDSGFSTCDDTTLLSDGWLVAYARGVNQCTNLTMNGNAFGCSTGGPYLSDNCIVNGDITGSYQGMQLSHGIYLYGNMSDIKNAGLQQCTAVISANNTLDCVDVLADGGDGKFYNTLFTASSEEFHGYDSIQRSKANYLESFDHDQVTNAFKAWCRGGVVTSQTASPPTGYERWYEHACEDTTVTFPCFRQFETTVQPGGSIEVEGQIRMADGEDLTDGGDIGPSLQIIDKFADPLVDSTASVLDTDSPATIDGTELGWQAVDVIWANQGDAPRQVIVRMIAWSDQGGATDIDEVWAIATYQDQIQTIYDNIGTPANIDSGGATIADNLKKIADDNSGADFRASRDSLNEIRTRGDLAWVTGASAASQNAYTIDTIVRTVGDDDGGTDADVDVVDGTYFSTGEVAATTKLEVDATFTTADAGEDPATVEVWGYYVGGGGHYIRVQAYNYTDTAFEDVGTIGIGAVVSKHDFSLSPQHINSSTGAMAVKFLHSAHSGITSHVLHIDKVIVTTTETSLLHSNVDDILEDTEAMRPFVVGYYDDANQAASGWCDIVNNVVYQSAIDGNSFTTIDVKDPSSPALLDQLVHGVGGVADFTGNEYSEVIGNYAYVTSIYSDAFHSIDVSDTSNISIADTITKGDIGGSSLEGPAGVAIVDDIWGRDRVAFVANYNGDCMTALDISDPETITHIVTTSVDSTNNNQMINIVRVGDYLYSVSRLSKMLNVWSIATTDTITSVYNLTDSTLLRFERLGGMCEANGDYLYLPCSTNDSVSVVDISNRELPVVVGYIRDTNILEGAYVPALVNSNNILCTGRYGNNVAHIDVSDPTEPFIVDYINDDTYLDGPDDIQWSHGLAYVTCTDGDGMMTILKFPLLSNTNAILSDTEEISSLEANLGQVHTIEDESPGGTAGAAGTSGIAEGC